MPLVRLQFHNDAAARQTLGDEGAGFAALRHGQHEFRLDSADFGVSDVAVLNWICDEARKLPDPAIAAEQVIITVDEMWHFIQKNSKIMDLERL